MPARTPRYYHRLIVRDVAQVAGAITDLHRAITTIRARADKLPMSDLTWGDQYMHLQHRLALAQGSLVKACAYLDEVVATTRYSW